MRKRTPDDVSGVCFSHSLSYIMRENLESTDVVSPAGQLAARIPHPLLGFQAGCPTYWAFEWMLGICPPDLRLPQQVLIW